MAFSFWGRFRVIRMMDPVCSRVTNSYCAVPLSDMVFLSSWPASVDDLLGHEPVVVVSGEAQQLLEDVLVVLAHFWGASEAVWPLAVDHPGRAERIARAATQPLDLADKRARGEVLVGDHIQGGERWRRRNTVRLE